MPLIIKTDKGSPYLVKGVKCNGVELNGGNAGIFEVRITQQDCLIEVDCRQYQRDKDMIIELSPTNHNVFIDVTLNPGGPMEKVMTLHSGENTISYNDADLPIAFACPSSSVYIGQDQMLPDENGYYLSGYTGGKVKLFDHEASPITITHKPFPSGVNATITHDGVQVAAGQSYSVVPGTKVKITATKGSNLVLESGALNFIKRDGNSSASSPTFTFNVWRSEDLWLHPENPYVNIKFTGNYDAFNYTDDKHWKNPFEEATTKIYYTYPAAAGTTYSMTINCPTKNYSVESVSSTPAGATYDAESGTLSGLKAGMTVNITTVNNSKPYKVNLNYLPPVGSQWNEAAQMWMSEEGYPLRPGFSMMFQDPGNYDNGEIMNFPLNYGENSSATVDAQYDFFQLGAENFPVTLMAQTTTEDAGFLIINDQKYTMNYMGSSERWNSTYGRTETVYMHQLVLDTPQEIIGTIYSGDPYTQDFTPAKVTITTNSEITYSVNNGTVKTLTPANPVVEDAYPGAKIVLYPASSSSISQATYTIPDYQVWDENSWNWADENGTTGGLTKKAFNWEWTVPGMNDGYVKSGPQYNNMYSYCDYNNFEINVEGPTMLVHVYSKTQQKVTVKNATQLDASKWTLPLADKIQIYTSVGYRIASVTGASGKAMDFDKYTGTVYNVGDGTTINVQVEPFARDKNLTLILPDNLSAGNVKVTLGKGSSWEASSDLATGSKEKAWIINYNPEDMPLAIENAMANGKPAVMYLNGSKVEMNADGEYLFPAELPEGSVIRAVADNGTTSRDVTFDFDDDLIVNVMVDGQMITIPAGTTVKTLPAGAKIRVSHGDGNKYNYSISGSYKTSMNKTINIYETNGIVDVPVYAASKNYNISAKKSYYTMILSANEEAMIADMEVSGDGMIYPYSLADKTVKIPTHVEKIKVDIKEDAYYVESINSGINGLTFDNRTGELTGLGSGSIELNIQPVVREMEFDVYSGGGMGDLGYIVLGKGTVCKKEITLPAGVTTVKYNANDLPIYFRPETSYLEDGDDIQTSELPLVYMNGSKVAYNEESLCELPATLFSADTPVPTVKVFAADGRTQIEKVDVTFLVENGINFNAVEDKVVEFNEPTTREMLPGTRIVMTATSNIAPIYVEVEGERIEPVDGKYTVFVTYEDMQISVLHEKLNLTVNAEEWANVRVQTNEMDYPLTSGSAKLAFPLSTKELTVVPPEFKVLVSALDEKGVQHYSGQDNKITNISNGMTLTLKFDTKYERTQTMQVYLEENGGTPLISELVLAAGTSASKTEVLNPGYNTIKIGDRDFPLAMTFDETNGYPMVYLNNEGIPYNPATGLYVFPTEIPENPVIKVYSEVQPVINVDYMFDYSNYEIKLTHDRTTEITNHVQHQLLPGTEIRFTVVERPAAQKRKAMAKLPSNEPSYKVTLNGSELTPENDGSYLYTVDKEDANTGLNFKVAMKDVTTGIDEIVSDGEMFDIYDLKGIMIKKEATLKDLINVPAGIYIVNGQKVNIRI